eukprot:m.56142 g.56142  ORF g.56142 m.56142 type:complete len:403 (+) comp7786_c0_seq1:19-1227(+)
MSDKEAKAKTHLATAEKALKTSIFKWKPEYDVASSEFEKAGLHFKLAKLYERATEAYVRAAECHGNKECTSTPYHVGKALESASTCAREAMNVKLSIDLLHQAAVQFRLTGKNAPACAALEKAAKMSEKDGQFDVAHEIWLEVSDLFEEEGKPRQCKRPMESAISSALRAGNKDAAIKALERQANLLDGNANATFVYQSVLSLIVVHLSEEDFVAADKAHQYACSTFSGFGSSTEGMLSIRLLQAFEDNDDSELNEIKRNQTFSFLLADVSSLAKTLQLSDMGVPTKRVDEDKARDALFSSTSSSSSKPKQQELQEPQQKGIQEEPQVQLEQSISETPPSYAESLTHADEKVKEDDEDNEMVEESITIGGDENAVNDDTNENDNDDADENDNDDSDDDDDGC